MRGEISYGFSIAADHNALSSLFNFFEEAGEVRFGLMYVECFH